MGMFNAMFKDLKEPVDDEVIEAYKFAFRNTGRNFCCLCLALVLLILSYEAEFYKPTVPLAAYTTMPGGMQNSIISFCSTHLILINGA
jgi:hypothetical protein